MSEMSVRLDPPVSNAVLVGVIAQDRDDVETAPLPALRLAGMGRGIAAKSWRQPSPVLRMGDHRWDCTCGFDKPV